MDDLDLAQRLFKRSRESSVSSYSIPNNTTTVEAIALADSVDGYVEVLLDNEECELATTFAVKRGDVCIVSITNNNPVITGVIGGGDIVNDQLDNIEGKIDDIEQTIGSLEVAETPFIVCETSSDDPKKIGTLISGDLSFENGSTILVEFTYSNVASNPTINIDDTGERKILTNGVNSAYWSDAQTVLFTYVDDDWFANAPVYADTVTVGNAAANHLYIDDDSVDIMSGDLRKATFTGDSIDFIFYKKYDTILSASYLNFGAKWNDDNPEYVKVELNTNESLNFHGGDGIYLETAKTGMYPFEPHRISMPTGNDFNTMRIDTPQCLQITTGHDEYGEDTSASVNYSRIRMQRANLGLNSTDSFGISANGFTLLAQYPLLTLSISSSISLTTEDQVVKFGTVRTESQINKDTKVLSVNTSTGRVTVNRAGLIAVSVTMGYITSLGTSAANTLVPRIRRTRSGSTATLVSGYCAVPSGQNVGGATIGMHVFAVNSGDIIDVTMANGAGSRGTTNTSANGNNFTIIYLGDA